MSVKEAAIKIRLTDLDKETIELAARYSGLDPTSYARRVILAIAVRDLQRVADRLPEDLATDVKEVIKEQLAAGVWLID